MLLIAVSICSTALAVPPPEAYALLGRVFMFLGEDAENSRYKVKPFDDIGLETVGITPSTEIHSDGAFETGDLMLVGFTDDDWRDAKTITAIKTLDGQVMDVNDDGSLLFDEYFMNTIALFIPDDIVASDMVDRHFMVQAFEVGIFRCDAATVYASALKELDTMYGAIVALGDDYIAIRNEDGQFTLRVDDDTKFNSTFPMGNDGGARYYTDDDGDMVAVSILIYQG